MKRFLLTIASLAFLGASSVNPLFAQTPTTITTSVPSYGGGSASPPPVGISFNVTNNNGGPIVITAVGATVNTSNTMELWYSSTSLTGATGQIVASNTDWTMLQSISSPTTTTTVNNNLFPGLSLVIPGGATYRFVVNCMGSIHLGSSATQTVYTSGGVTLDITNTMWGGSTFTNGMSITGRYFLGSITFLPAGPPCPAPAGISINNIVANAADISWGPVSGSIGYEYVVDQLPADPLWNTPVTTTTTTSFAATGLTPSTLYYVHLRNKCTEYNKSPWLTDSFRTLPPCEPPINFRTSDLKPTSTDIEWDPWPSASSYDFVVDQNRDDPGTSTGISNSTSTSHSLSGLQENTWYYVHIRSNCFGTQTSKWMLDSFLTPIPCRPPQVMVSDLWLHQGVLHWDPVPSALWYEYLLSKSPNEPALGTKYEHTSLHASALQEGQVYYFHTRSYCRSVGVESYSPWAKKEFRTVPLGVQDIHDGSFQLAMFPNPANDQLNLEALGRRDGEAQIQIVDLSGKIVLESKMAKDQITVDLSGIAPGVYLVKYKDAARQLVQRLTKK